MGRWAVVLLLAGCGRVGFDPIAGRAGDASPVMDDSTVQPAIPPGAGIWLQMETDPTVAVIDSAGGHTAKCVTACPERAGGVHGGGYHFTSSLISVAYSADLDPSSGYSAAIWLELDSIPTGPAQWAFWNKPRDSTGGDTFTFYVDSSGNINFDCDDLSQGYSITAGPIAPGTWHHVAVTWDGTTKLGYLDGAPVGSINATCLSSPAAFELGADYSPPELFVAGTVDDAVFYTRVLSPAEITQLATR